jgi:hypothetical protein
MQERVRAIEFVLARCGVQPAAREPAPLPPRPQRVVPPTLDSWPHYLSDYSEHKA